MSQATAPRRVSRARLPLSATSPGARKAPASSGPAVRLRVVAPADSRHSGGLAFVVSCVVVLALGLATLLLLNTQRAQQSFTIDGLRAQSARMTDTQQSMRSQLQGVEAAPSLAKRAQAMGLVPATHIRYVGPDGKTIGVAKGAAGASPLILGALTTSSAGRVAQQAAVGVSLGSSVGGPAPAKAVNKPGSLTKSKKPDSGKAADTTSKAKKPSMKKSDGKGAKDKKTSGTPATTTR